MSAFTPAEIEYLSTQPLMRFASASMSGRPDVAPVVFDLASTNLWSPRGKKVIGSCVVESHGGGERFRISPEVIISWAINDTTPGIPAMERRVVEV